MARDTHPTGDPLRDQLSRALGSRYQVEHVLGAGGMGVVYLARDATLDRFVAVKVIPPELATAVAVERFHREAKTLADLTHPNVVPVFDFGESEGLLYYLMQFVEGETLRTRIDRGPVESAAALDIAKQLLDALEAAHRRGIIHRDVKPSNVMLVGDRVLLTDFGIAKRLTPGDETLTAPESVIGTLRYVAPEALSGEVSTQSDLYSAAIVIYEVLTGREWQGAGRPDDADWSGVPTHLRDPLLKALALAPADRWPDVAAFKRALVTIQSRRPAWTRPAAVGLTLAALAVGTWFVTQGIGADDSSRSQLTLAIPPFAYSAGRQEDAWVADSITDRVRRSLEGPDVRVARAASGRRPEVTGAVTVARDSVRVTLTAQSIPLAAVAPQPVQNWSAVADSAALRVWYEVWRRFAGQGPVPSKVIPHDPAAFERFLHGERLFALARWPEAAGAYARAEALDSTCLLCTWRLLDVGRWLSAAPDETRYRRLLQHVDSFPAHYQAVIRSAVVPTVSRVDSLRLAVERWPDFWTAWFHLAEELFHRGPLIGHPRRDAEAAYVQVTRLNPTFAPAWHHLAWLRTAEGDRSGAAAALDSLERAGHPEDFFSLAVSAYVHVGFAWRFQPVDSARGVTAAVLNDPRMMDFPDLGAGARFLVGFDAPEGALSVAAMLDERNPSPLGRRSARLAEVLGNVALGRPAAAREAVTRLRAAFDNPEIALFSVQLDAALALFGPADPASAVQSAERLEEYAGPQAGAAGRRRRAAYLAVLLRREQNANATGSRYDELLSQEERHGSARTRPFTTLLAADSLARRGELEQALSYSLALTGSLDSSETVDDPFFRTVHHLKRAEWYARRNNVDFAYAELGWFENSDIAGSYPTLDPKNAEVDWAFGVEARWRRATLLDEAGRHTRVACDAYRAVVRLWSGGEPAYAARAEEARDRLVALSCPA